MSEFNGFLFNELHKLKWIDENVDDGIELQKKAPTLYSTLKNSTHSMEIIQDTKTFISQKSDHKSRMGSYIYFPVKLNILMFKAGMHWYKIFRFVNTTNRLRALEMHIKSFSQLEHYMNDYRKNIAYFGNDHIVYIHLNKPKSEDPNDKTNYGCNLTILYPSDIEHQIDIIKHLIRDESEYLFGDKVLFIYTIQYDPKPNDLAKVIMPDISIHKVKFTSVCKDDINPLYVLSDIDSKEEN